MPASAIFALKGASGEGVPIDTRQFLANGWRSSLGDAIPLMLFRMGFAKPLPIVAGRREVQAYVDTENG